MSAIRIAREAVVIVRESVWRTYTQVSVDRRAVVIVLPDSATVQDMERISERVASNQSDRPSGAA